MKIRARWEKRRGKRVREVGGAAVRSNFGAAVLVAALAMAFAFTCAIRRAKAAGSGGALHPAKDAARAASGEAPLRVGIAGLVHGHVFGFFHEYLHSPLIQIVGIAEADQDLSARAAKDYGLRKSLFYSNLDEMIEKTHPQTVLIYSDTYDHRKLVEICARHHVDAMMEKPLAVSYADALAMDRAAKEGGIQVMVNYETTWYASNQAAYDLLHSHAIGDLRKFVAHDGHRGPKEIGVGPDFMKWLTDPKLDGAGALYDFGCYGADLVTWLLDGEEPVSVTAVTQQIKPDEYPNVDDEATVIVTYPKAQAILQASWNWPFDRKDIEVYGQSGYVKTVLRDRVLVRTEKSETLESAKLIPAPDDDELNYLRAVVLDKKVPEGPSSLKINLVTMEILDAARESAKSGKTVELHR
ncbi:MAG TPA: Gfo/Idh/MocA family oxidoreductase [Candidatus Acidoferrales bacterium]|nr:Gfo/Idh/MocA family oxidoreductase [Candidatus Acidoferrales bacterium]